MKGRHIEPHSKGIVMRKLMIYAALVVMTLFCTSSCNRKIVPGIVSGKSYDVSAFNFVYVEAIKQKLLGNSGDALRYLEQCVKIYPESDAAYYQMAQIIVAGGDLTNGKKYALKALAIDDKNLWYIMMVAGMYYQEKKIDSAILYYEKAVKTFPDNDKLLLTLGNLYSENNNFDQALSIFNSFDDKYGVNEISTISAINSLMSSKMFDEAYIKASQLLEKKPDELLYNGLLAEIYRGMGEKQKALDVYNNLIERNPGNAATQLSLCDFLITEKSYDELFVFLSSVILNSNITREDKISLLARIIEIPDFNSEQQDKVTLSLMVLEANYKDDDIIPLLRTELLINQKRLSEAATRLEEIIKINRQNYYAWEKLLLVYLQLNDYERLTRKGEECASMFNMSFLAKVLYATGAIETKKYEIAVEELRKAEILAGVNIDYLLQVLALRADLFYKKKDYTKSFEVFKQAININRNDLTILNNYAYYLAEQNMKLNEAEAMARRVIEKEGTNTTFLDTYAWVLYKRGKLKNAAKIMESIINSGGEPNAEWYEHYGFILKKQKKCKEAIINWDIALKLEPSKIHLNTEIANCVK
jgi:tetratricopeptide (TPR) repeat protein